MNEEQVARHSSPLPLVLLPPSPLESNCHSCVTCHLCLTRTGCAEPIRVAGEVRAAHVIHWPMSALDSLALNFHLAAGWRRGKEENAPACFSSSSEQVSLAP